MHKNLFPKSKKRKLFPQSENITKKGMKVYVGHGLRIRFGTHFLYKGMKINGIEIML